MASTSYIEISTKALRENVDFIRSLISEETRISAVVKGNAYGHGISQVVPALQEFGIDHFAVFSSHEAKEVFRYILKNSNIMIMGFVDNQDLNWMIDNDIEFFVADLELLKTATQIAEETGKPARIHIELETGMYRTGFSSGKLSQAIKWIEDHGENLLVKGVASHLAGAESIANHQRIRKQLTTYKRRVTMLKKKRLGLFTQHIASSAATIAYPETHLDMIRTGILLYGYWPTWEIRMNYIHRLKSKDDPLKRVLNWYSTVMQVKRVPEGEFIGYGLSYQAYQDMKVMIVPVGYCNGFSRSLSNNGHVIVHGQRSEVIGLINMNMAICDISQINGVKRGDTVILVGQQGEAEITFSSFAEMNNSMNYEVLSRLPENIERKLI